MNPKLFVVDCACMTSNTFVPKVCVIYVQCSPENDWRYVGQHQVAMNCSAGFSSVKYFVVVQWGWLELMWTDVKDVWKCFTVKRGELFAATVSAIFPLRLSAINSVSGMLCMSIHQVNTKRVAPCDFCWYFSCECKFLHESLRDCQTIKYTLYRQVWLKYVGKLQYYAVSAKTTCLSQCASIMQN